ncbi:transmembrane protein 208-like isoform X3 [Carya illinoinensis]|uniref:transmembrane protein 208-like isoform X3 n=1 Tax=Carya illinoinensis TaxID=32201 RepID=UPI001C71A237|nr:transmembrane protein 208-like isoform X3 [Carya illinoinensis]
MANQGAKKRKEENARHMANLRRIIIVCNVIYVLVRMVVFHSSFTWKHWIGLILTSVAYLIPYQQLARMAQPAYADDGELFDGGFDMTTGGVCGYLHDVIYITSFVQVMSIISGKFWYTYLVPPSRHCKPQFCSILTSHLDQHESPLAKQASTDRDTQLTIQPQGTTHLAVNRQEHQKTQPGELEVLGQPQKLLSNASHHLAPLRLCTGSIFCGHKGNR